MRRSGVVVTLSSCGLLVLAACGPGGSGGGTLSPGAAGPGSAAQVRIGPYTEVFTGPLPADPARAHLVEGFREGEVLWNRSLVAFRLVAPVRDYVTGTALGHLVMAIAAGKRNDVVPAGTDRLFMTRITAMTASRAQIITCDDGSGFREQNARTGKANPAFAALPQQQYVLETWHMGLLRGNWAITDVSVATLPSSSAEACQPGLVASALPRPPGVTTMLAAMSAAMRGASSVHISGTVRQGTHIEGLDLAVTRSGGIAGQISQAGKQITMLVTRGHTYVKVTPAFLQLAGLPASDCARLCGKYLITTTQAAGLGSATMSALIGHLTRAITSTPARQVSYAGIMAVHGQPAWLLQGVRSGTAFIAARGKPFLLRLAGPLGQGVVDFTQWDAVRIPGPPPASQVITPGQLGG